MAQNFLVKAMTQKLTSQKSDNEIQIPSTEVPGIEKERKTCHLEKKFTREDAHNR